MTKCFDSKVIANMTLGWLITFTFSLIFSIPQFVVAGIYWNDDCQDTDGWGMRLDIWLVVGGVIGLINSLISLPIRWFIHTLVGIVVFALWNAWCFTILVIWNIVGTVTLFKYSDDCKDDAAGLWILSLIILILQWLLMYCYICCGGSSVYYSVQRQRKDDF